MTHRTPHDHETLDVLLRGKVELLQAKRGYRTSVDAMALAFFAASHVDDVHTCIDLGAGSGLVSILIGKRFRAAHLVLVERQPQMAERAGRNLRLAGLEARAEVVTCDVAQTLPMLPLGDLIVCNPPYYQIGPRVAPRDPERLVAHCETTAGIERFVAVAATLLAPGGALCVVYPIELAKRALAALETAGLGRIGQARMLHRVGDTSASRVLLHARRAVTSELSLLPDMHLHPEGAPDSIYDPAIESFLASL